jgi:hypothetical protein
LQANYFVVAILQKADPVFAGPVCRRCIVARAREIFSGRVIRYLSCCQAVRQRNCQPGGCQQLAKKEEVWRAAGPMQTAQTVGD